MDRNEYQKFNISISVLQKSGWYDVLPLCNGFTVTNIGDTDCVVNDQIYYAGVPGSSLGDSRTFGGNENELYVGRVKVSFIVPLNAAPQIELVQKVYIKKDQQQP